MQDKMFTHIFFSISALVISILIALGGTWCKKTKKHILFGIVCFFKFINLKSFFKKSLLF